MNTDGRRHKPQFWQIGLAVLACALFFGGCITQPQGVIINTKPTPTPTPVVGDPNNPKVIEVTLSDNTVPPTGVGIIWVKRSVGWAPYESPGDGRLPPDEYGVQVFIDGERIGVFWPDETGGMGPRPLAIPQNVWGFALGQHTLKFVQEGPEVWRESNPVIIVVTEDFKPTPTIPPSPHTGSTTDAYAAAHATTAAVACAAADTNAPVCIAMAARAGESIGIVLLAAGESQRMVAAAETKIAKPKALLPWLGRPLIQYQLEQITAIAPAHVVVVTGFHAERLAPHLAPFTDVHVVENPEPARGRSSSIVHGLQALPEGLSAIAVVNVDQPCAAATLELLIRAISAENKRIAIPRYQGKRGHPPLFASALRDELRLVREETQGLKAVTRAYRAETAYVDVDDPSVVWNLNTPDDYRRAQQQHILLATTNSAKAEHLAWLLEDVPLRPVTLAEANLHAEVPPAEADRTLKAIAESKAIAWSRKFGGLAIASDGGIAIPALGESWEARLTARFAGSNATDAQRVEALLALLRPYHDTDRQAFFRECVALANNGTLLQSWCAESAPGLIAESYEPEQIVPGFWLLTVWCDPSSGRRGTARSPSEPGYPDGAWARIKPSVQQFLRSYIDSQLTSAT